MSDDKQLDKEDAERFRWIQEQYALQIHPAYGGHYSYRFRVTDLMLYGRNFREAIDNAMERAKGGSCK